MTNIIDNVDCINTEQEEYVQELQRLLACYQLASRDDKNVVWAALNKYMPSLTL